LSVKKNVVADRQAVPPTDLKVSVPLYQSDLMRLGPLVVENLKDIFQFVDASFWPASVHVDGLPPVKMSDRQRIRAKEAYEKQEGFWDRVGQQVFIPVTQNGFLLGSISFAGVSRVISPDESGRWLPLLKRFVESEFKRIKRESTESFNGSPPLYLDLVLEAGQQEACEHCWLLHLGKAGGKKDFPEWGECVQLCEELWGRNSAEWLGGNSSEGWILLTPDKELGFEPGFRRLKGVTLKRKLAIGFSFGHLLRASFSKEVVRQEIAYLEGVAAELRTQVFCTHDLAKLRARLGMDDILGAISAVRSKTRAGAYWVLAYSKSPLKIENHLPGNKISVLRTGNESFFLMKKVVQGKGPPRVEDVVKEFLSVLKSRVNSPAVTLGIAASWQPTVGVKYLPVAALWAFIHADMLGEGSVALFDSLTWNVKGDEILSWGDVTGACRSFRMGLKMRPDDENLLNSLGVCCAELGRKKQAVECFKRALSVNPDDYMAYYNLGGVYLKMGDHEAAKSVLESALQLRPNDLHVITRLASVYLRLNFFEKALSLLLPVTGKGNSLVQGSLYRLLGKAYQGLGQWQEAKRAWKAALGVNPSDSEATAFLALAYWEYDGDKETALRLSRQADCLGRGNKIVQQIIKKIKPRLKDALNKETLKN